MRFRRLKKRFWATDDLSQTFAPLTQAAIDRAEAALGVRLPAEYVELLRVQNGGYVSERFDAFPTSAPTTWAEDHVWFRELLGIGDHDEWPSVTMSATPLEHWRVPPGLVVLSGEVHWCIALDFRAGEPPAVVWFAGEIGEELPLAPSFRAFAEGLVSMDSFDDVILPETRHVARGDSGLTYCGYDVDEHAVREEELGGDVGHVCATCVRLMGEWREAEERRRRA